LNPLNTRMDAKKKNVKTLKKATAAPDGQAINASGSASGVLLPSGSQGSKGVDRKVSDAPLVAHGSGVAAGSVSQPGTISEGEGKAVSPLRSATAVHTDQALIRFRPYQLPVFLDRESGILILHWSRQIGKSFTLAAWAVDRLLTQLQKYNTWLITVLSNSRDNGAEFVIKCHEVARLFGLASGTRGNSSLQEGAVYETEDQSPDVKFENMRMEVRVTVGGKVGRIKVLAANPRTARGFSGDLILDEFAFHEDSNAIWEAAEPILSANPEFLCRIASTGNGTHNMFYRMVAGTTESAGTADATESGTPNPIYVSAAGFKVCRVRRTDAWRQGVKVYDPVTRKPITPDEARAKALDKRAYDQNYECAFAAENMALLTHELISAAERSLITIDDQAWSAASLARMHRAKGRLCAGQDVGRNRDISVLTVLEIEGGVDRVIGMLRMSGMRLPSQQVQLDAVCALPKFDRIEIDMTGLGIGLVEYAQEKWGDWKVRGVNFATTEPISDRIKQEGRKQETARVTEIMATDLLGRFEDRAIEIPVDGDLRDDLRKPEKITSATGRVSIAAVRDDAGHADHFWSLALAVRAKGGGAAGVMMEVKAAVNGTRAGWRSERSVVG
jgi:phage FluMu gp28-like protein